MVVPSASRTSKPLQASAASATQEVTTNHMQLGMAKQCLGDGMVASGIRGDGEVDGFEASI